jgi:hypothetical protein
LVPTFPHSTGTSPHCTIERKAKKKKLKKIKKIKKNIYIMLFGYLSFKTTSNFHQKIGDFLKISKHFERQAMFLEI